MKHTVGLVTMGALLTLGSSAYAQQINEGFDNVTTLIPAGWVTTNLSAPIGTSTWSQGDATVFASHSGATNSYIFANYLSGSGTADLSNWLITPVVTIANGATLSFWTRTVNSPAFADRLQVRASINGMSSNVGATSSSVGDFTFLLQDINPGLTPAGYPNVWTQFTITVSGLPAGNQTGRYAFRYFVTNGGPNGANSDYIGIDDVVVANVTPTAVCGNGIREGAEACDDGNTANGDCCSSTCAFETAATVCRAAANACDVAETCTGMSAMCPPDNKAPNGTVCSDGNACTQTDTCLAGTCTGANPVVCSASDQCHDAGTCNTMTGMCSNPAKADGTACNDANLCTQSDTCVAGACTGANPVVCMAMDQCHDVGTCAPATGMCSNPAKMDGAACNDGNACTQLDSCLAGACNGAMPVMCAAMDQCHDAGTCDTMTGMCSNPAKADGSSCNDGNACTQTDSCQAGACAGAMPVVCTAMDQCHDVGTCDTATGTCSNPAKADGATCDDGDACTQTDTCTAGACGGANPVTCTAADECHEAGMCDVATGMCSSPAVADGTACTGGTCQGGMCIPAGCGNNIKDTNEECDDGNMVDGDGCDKNCTNTACGNNIVTMGEECDDGNTTDGDGCAADCTKEGGAGGAGGGGTAGAGGMVGTGGEGGSAGSGGGRPNTDTGCGCTVVGSDNQTAASGLLFGLLALLGLRRRKN